ncbi:2149_t:CDS:2 [Rhizophagus irregularis]|nr:2149_t:CDS:2 [Rhizophagus irregularis]
MDAGGVQVQHQPSNQDPTRQSWRNNSSNGDQGKRRDSGSNKSKPANLKSINVERAQNMSTTSRNVYNNNMQQGAPSIRTPKTAQFPKQNHQQQMYVMQPKTATFVKNDQRQQQMNLPRSSPQMLNLNNRSSPPQTVFISRSPPQVHNLSRSPPKINNGNTSSSRPTPKPLNLSKSSSQVHNNLGRVPQTATFPPKVNRALNLPNPPKSATLVKPSSGFPKDIRQSIRQPQSATIPQQAYTYVYGEQQSAYLQAIEQQSRIRCYGANPASFRFVSTNYRELGSGTPVVVLSHPDDSDSQGSSPPTPGYLPSDGYNGADNFDLNYIIPYEEEAEEGPYCYYYYDYPQEYIPPQTPTGTSHQQRSSTTPSTAKEERRRSVFGGPMKVHPDAVLPIRQPKGPDMAKNFATRIRRKAVNKLFAAAAERRSKSAADRRKSALF